MGACEHEIFGDFPLGEEGTSEGEAVDESGGDEVDLTIGDGGFYGIFDVFGGHLGVFEALGTHVPVFFEGDDAELVDDGAVVVTEIEDGGDIGVFAETGEDGVFAMAELFDVGEGLEFGLEDGGVATEFEIGFGVQAVEAESHGDTDVADFFAVGFVGEL